MLAKFGMRRKQNFDIVFGFKSSTAQHFSTFTFRFPSLLGPLFSLSLLHFFCFQLAGHLVGFILFGRKRFLDVFCQIVIKGFEKKKKKKIAKTLFGVPRATFDPKRERLIGP